MPATVIDGKKIADRFLEKAKQQAEQPIERHITPKLAVVLVGKNKASELYVKRKKQACERVGVEFDLKRFEETVTEKELVTLVKGLNSTFSVHGILVQLPLPQHIDQHRILDQISPLKDVDGFTSFNIGLLAHGKEEFVACTAKGIVNLIESTSRRIEGSNACIVNHSIVVGKPLALMLLNRNATVTTCHEFTKDVAQHTKQADFLITAVGKPGLIKADMVKEGAVVIDAGIAREGSKLLGDVEFEKVKEVASFITPVPGGVGPMTVACLLENTVRAAQLQHR